MGKMIDRTGMRYGRLLVLGKGENYIRPNGQYGSTTWRCQCQCGNVVSVTSTRLATGATTSCGCWFREQLGNRRRTHGLSKTPEYKIWKGMKNRCFNQNDPGYLKYGARGISVDPVWMDFERFYRDMGPRPSPDYSIDRIDNNGNYEPSNCRWASRTEQMSNRQNTTWVTYQGRRMSVPELSRLSGLSIDVLHVRIKRGWPEDQLLTPVSRGRSLANRMKQEAAPSNPTPHADRPA